MKSLVNLALKIRGSLNKGGDHNYISKIEMGSSIPKVIHQTYYSSKLPAEIQQNIDQLKSMNPDWEHRLYDDQDIEDYIKLYYPKLLPIYKKINPVYGAAKADFFRYIVMYNEGGIYLDIKSSMSKPLKEVLLPTDKYLLCHWENDVGKIHEKIGFHACIANPFGEFQQWHIAASKGHPFLKAVIENVCHNINHYNPFIHDTGGWAVVNSTGPIAYTLAISPILNLYPHRLERDNSNLGLVYSIYESKGLGMGHYSNHNKHYTLRDDSLTKLPILWQTTFNILKPAIKLLKASLIRLRQ